jgi:tRNA(Arg) A34 adenosine deaminase TadA
MPLNYNLILDKILLDLLPLTKNEINKGNKIFGSIILNKKNYSTIAVGTNNEIINPLFHGEISSINNFFSNKVNINPRDCLFISSHEPCSLCLSAITWSGFDNFIFLFPYEDTKNSFKIPHDLKILEEVFNIKKGKYNRNNQYWKSYSIMKEILKLHEEKRDLINIKIKKIEEIYINFSNLYQKNKSKNKIPLN